MHHIQAKILDLSHTRNLGNHTLREIGELVGEPHPQKIKHHLDQLGKKGLLVINKAKGNISPTKKEVRGSSSLLALPILGAANCGQAVTIAEERIEGYLRVSPGILKKKSKALFVLRASGNSMNRAALNRDPSQSIEDGDFVIVDGEDRTPKSGDYIVSIIDGCANIKKYRQNDAGQIVLVSESSVDYPPIYIDKDDMEHMSSYMINGKVVQVIKKPVS